MLQGPLILLVQRLLLDTVQLQQLKTQVLVHPSQRQVLAPAQALHLPTPQCLPLTLLLEPLKDHLLLLVEALPVLLPVELHRRVQQ